jgi:hypothetical protein
MLTFFTRSLVLTALVAASVPVLGCTTDSRSVDSVNGKAISELDIGADITLNKGSTQQATATVKYADGTSAGVTTSSDLVWNVGNADVATISADGLVTGKNVGATSLKATYQGKESASHALIVK